jgi:hypothetical protein
MESGGLEKYASLMTEVKLRVEHIDRLMSGADNLPLPPRFECAALQFRKILELIAFGSLVANEKIYASTYKDFSKEWNAKKLLAKLGNLNPNFYPVPVKQVKTDMPGILLKHEKITQAYLSKAEFIVAYQKCSEFIHTKNPYSINSPLNFQDCAKVFADWKSRIVTLLTIHELHLYKDPGMAVCSMNDGGTNQVKVYRFAPPGSAGGAKP